MVYTIFHIYDLENQLFHKSRLEPSIEYTFTLIFYGCSRIQPVNQTFSEATIVNLTKKVGLIKFGQMIPFPPSEPGLERLHSCPERLEKIGVHQYQYFI